MSNAAGNGTPGAPRDGMDVLVQVANARYRCHLGQGCDVSARPSLTLVPGTPAWLLGLVLAREQVVPVVDLARVLGIPGDSGPGASSRGEDGTGTPPSHARMLTVRESGLCVAFLVDDVRDAPDAALPALNLGNVAGALSDRLRASLGRNAARG